MVANQRILFSEAWDGVERERTQKYERVKVQNDIRTSKHKQTSPIFNCVTPVSVSLATLARQIFYIKTHLLQKDCLVNFHETGLMKKLLQNATTLEKCRSIYPCPDCQHLFIVFFCTKKINYLFSNILIIHWIFYSTNLSLHNFFRSLLLLIICSYYSIQKVNYLFSNILIIH